MSARRLFHCLTALVLGLTFGCSSAGAGSPSDARRPAPVLSGRTPAPANTTRWLVVSDIHFDPFADPSLVPRLLSAPAAAWPALLAGQAKARPSTYGRDTNAALLLSALAEMQRVNPDPAVVFVPGDFLAHRFGARFRALVPRHDRAAYQAFVFKTMDYVAHELRRTFPRAQILPAIGNNDSTCGDYEGAPNDAFLAHVARTWAPLVNVDGRAPAFVTTFSSGGYYEARLPAPGPRVVVPNSVFWSIRYRDRCDPADPQPGGAELGWLARTLERRAPGERTWLMTHIPPGIDTFKTSLKFGLPSLLYVPATQQRFLGELDDRRAGVRAMIAGHLHAMWFRQSAAGSSADVPILIAPSISPIFGNDPTFLELVVRPAAAEISNVRGYSLGGLFGEYGRAPAWHLTYDVDAAYGMNGLTPSSLSDLHRREERDPWLQHALDRNAASNGIARLVTGLDRRSSWCAETALTAEAFVACHNR